MMKETNAEKTASTSLKKKTERNPKGKERERENDRPFVFQGCSSLLTLKAYKAEERLKRPWRRLRERMRERRKVFSPLQISWIRGFSLSLSSSSGFFPRPYFTAGEPLTWKRSRSVRMMFAFCRVTFLRGFFSRAWERSEILDAKSRICTKLSASSLGVCIRLNISFYERKHFFVTSSARLKLGDQLTFQRR